MKVSFTKKKWISFILGIVIVVALSVGGYFYLIYPKVTVLANTKNQIEMEQKMLDVLEGNVPSEEETISEQTTQMQRKLPVKPLVDQLLLDFQKVEALSNTYIVNIDINQNLDVSSQEEDVAEVNDTDETNDTTQEAIPMIEGLKQIQAYLSIRAKGYEDLFQFLAEIDQLPRIISIDSISFMGNDEKIMIDDEQETLEFSVTVSTYYYPNLHELKDQHPKVIYPDPSEKENPFYNR